MQIDLLVNSFVNDMARVATLQYMRKSVGQAQMRWLGIKDGHHSPLARTGQRTRRRTTS